MEERYFIIKFIPGKIFVIKVGRIVGIKYGPTQDMWLGKISMQHWVNGWGKDRERALALREN